jgi:glycerophosphoryl diester phosphodiesterase
VRGDDGSLWIGDDFGPFLLHFSSTGVLLEPPVRFPAGKSPANPFLAPGETPRIGSSRGFEAMAGRPDGEYLYPVAEGAFADDADKRRRWIYQYDVRAGEYTDRRWAYQTDFDGGLVGDAFMTSPTRMLVVERDDFDGPAAVIKRVYEIDLARTDQEGFVRKSLVLDALAVQNPDLIGAGTGYGTGREWSLPVQSFEYVVPLQGDRLLSGNDNNYPGNNARNPGTPDDTEMAVIDLRRVKNPSRQSLS